MSPDNRLVQARDVRIKNRLLSPPMWDTIAWWSYIDWGHQASYMFDPRMVLRSEHCWRL
jgi:hypothetical protein